MMMNKLMNGRSVNVGVKHDGKKKFNSLVL